MKNSYKEFSLPTAKYLNAVEKFLITKYGAVNDEWKQPLVMLANNVEMYYQCSDIIKREGLIVTAKNGYPSKNPAILIQIEAQKQINKLLDSFGLTPKAASKISFIGEDDDELKDLLGD